MEYNSLLKISHRANFYSAIDDRKLTIFTMFYVIKIFYGKLYDAKQLFE